MNRLRVVIGVLLVLHGLAHASAGMWATDIGGQALVTVLWEGATLGFMAAGAGLIGLGVFQGAWKFLIVFAAANSLALLLLYGHPLFFLGIAADLAFLGVALVLPFRPPSMVEGGWVKAARAASIGLMLYTGTVIALRPWYSSWGTTRSERQMVMIGDPPIGKSHYRIDHAITIDAPVDSIWPWMVQIGQDRGGFYSYDWLERAFGADIRNADVIVPAWQTREVGDTIHAVQRDYLNGAFNRTLAWRISELVPGRAMVLEKWGAFVIEPIDEHRTRLHIRTRGDGTPSVSGIALSPISLLTLEPAHFIMERGMMLGIKRRAESTVQTQQRKDFPYTQPPTSP